MISHLRIMFGVIIAAMVMGVLIVFIASKQKPTKYTIKIPNGSHGSSYQTNNYTSNGNCITFKNECGCKTDDIITVCGNYTIITNKK
jgi:hypothetical protein